MEERQRSCAYSEILDGVIVVSSNWSVFSAAVAFHMFPSFKAVEVESRSFKGVQFAVEDQNLYKVPLGLYQTQFAVNLVVGAPDNNANLNTLGSEILSYFFRAVSNLPNSLTCSDWATKPDNQKRTIYLTEVVLIGNSVLEFIRHEHPEWNAYLVAIALGPSCPYNRLDQILRDFELQHAIQLIVHFAYDFEDTEQSLFFGREYLRNLLGKRNLKSEYFVCLLKGMGNFYFNVGHLASPNNLTFIDTKFYSEAFKSFHRSSGSQFKYPELCYMVMDPRQFSKGFVRTTHQLSYASKLATVRNVQEVIQQYGRQISTLKARFEIIVRLEGEAILNAQVVVPTALSEHLQLNPRSITRCLVRVRTSSLGIHLRRHLCPFLATMEELLSARVELQGRNGANTFDPQSFLNCLASEAVTAFTLYGNVYYRNGRYLYPAWLTKALKIERSDYKYKERQTPLWLFDSVRRIGATVLFLHPAFQLTPILKKLQIRCRIEEKYVQLFVKLEKLIRVDRDEACSIEYNHLVLSIAKLFVESSIEASAFKLLSRLPRNFHQFSIARKLEYLKNAAAPGMCAIVDTTEFVDCLFLGKYLHLKFITWLSSIASFLLKEKLQELKLATRNYLEEELFEHGSFLVVPAQDEGYFTVAPFSGTPAENFSRLTLETKLSLIEHFQFFYPPASASGNLMQILSRDWSNRPIWEMILEIGDIAYV